MPMFLLVAISSFHGNLDHVIQTQHVGLRDLHKLYIRVPTSASIFISKTQLRFGALLLQLQIM